MKDDKGECVNKKLPDKFTLKSAAEFIEGLRVLTEQCCPACDYDEADGGLFCHCDACCKKIVTDIYGVLHP